MEGKAVDFKVNGEDRSVGLFPCDDKEGVGHLLCFTRDGVNKYVPVSREAAEALMYLLVDEFGLTAI